MGGRRVYNGGMRFGDEGHRIGGWSHGEGVFLESYVYAPGPAESLARHSHEEYQFGLSLNFPGEYRYLGSNHPVPAGSLSVVHPGEVHSARDPEYRRHPAAFRMMYVSPSLMEKVVEEVTGRGALLPFFRPVALDRTLSRAFLAMHLRDRGPASELERGSRLLGVLAGFFARHADAGRAPAPVGRERRAVREAREYLQDNPAEKVSLDRLARLVNLSRFHLARAFSEEVGLPPHAYQTQARIARAKPLLLDGWPISRVAREVGFADQSHFTRRFKDLVGVTPGRYLDNGKNVQDGRLPA